MVFYHVHAENNWRDILMDQCTKLVYSGLYEAAIAVNVGVSGPTQQVCYRVWPPRTMRPVQGNLTLRRVPGQAQATLSQVLLTTSACPNLEFYSLKPWWCLCITSRSYDKPARSSSRDSLSASSPSGCDGGHELSDQLRQQVQHHCDRRQDATVRTSHVELHQGAHRPERPHLLFPFKRRGISQHPIPTPNLTPNAALIPNPNLNSDPDPTRSHPSPNPHTLPSQGSLRGIRS